MNTHVMPQKVKQEHRPFSEAEIRMVRALVQAGKNDVEVGREIDRHPKTIQRLRGRLGLMAAHPVKLWTEQEMEQLEYMFRLGRSDEEIGQALGRGVWSIKNKREALGLDADLIDRRKPLEQQVAAAAAAMPRKSRAYTKAELEHAPRCSIDADFSERHLANAAYLFAAVRAGHHVYKPEALPALYRARGEL